MTETEHDRDDMSDYVDVDERLAMFLAKYPEGSLQPVNPAEPFTITHIRTADGLRTFVVYTASAYRTPDDQRPGIGCAWEPFPGRSEYTRNSELMNAETSAWGRAIRAVMRDDNENHVATKQDVVKRRAEKGKSAKTPAEKLITRPQFARLTKAVKAAGIDEDTLLQQLQVQYGDGTTPDTLLRTQATEAISNLEHHGSVFPAKDGE